MNFSRSAHVDAWTYYEFGTRASHDQIGALVERYLAEVPDSDGILSQLGEQLSTYTFPVIPIYPQGISLESETVDPQGVCRVTQLLLPIKLDEKAVAVADFGEARELMTKSIDRLSRRVALDLTFAFLHGRSLDSSIPTLAEMTQAVEALGPDR